MNDDDKNNPGPQPWIDPAMEARIVAYVMGEASAFEAEELERLIAANPELAIFRRRIATLHGLMVESIRPPWPKVQLSLDRRQKLLEIIGAKAQTPLEKVRVLSRPNPAWWSSQVLIRLAACLVMLGIVIVGISSVVRFEARTERPDFMAFSDHRGSVRADADVAPSGIASSQPRSGGNLDGLSVSTAPVPVRRAQPITVAAPAIVMGQAEALPVTFSAMPAAAPVEMRALKKSKEGASGTSSDALYADYAKNQTQTASAPMAFDAKAEVDKSTGIAPEDRAAAVNQDEFKSMADASSVAAPGWNSLYMYRGVNTLKYSQDEYNVRDKDVANQEAVDSIKAAEAKDEEVAKRSVATADGSINYGSPIAKVSPPVDAPNVVAQPVFATASGAIGNVSSNSYYRSSGDQVQSENVEPSVSGYFGSAKARFGSGSLGVQGLVQQGQSFLETGRFDLAGKRYEQALAIDPNDFSARQGLEQVASARAQYQTNSYNEGRSRMLMQVDKGWELPVRRFEIGAGSIVEQPMIDSRSSSLINRKLDEIVIPHVDFHDATLREALDFIKQSAQKLDSTEPDTSHRGINIVMKVDPESAEAEARITLALSDMPLRDALEYVAKAANLKLKVEPYAVSIVPQAESTPTPLKPTPTPTPSAEIPTSQQPISTFSLHVSEVSFQLAKDALAKGTMPDPSQIRPEEFYNAFDYNDPAPAPGEEVACRIEECAHPLMQQRDLVRIALKVAAAGRAAGQPLRLTILLDTSGSMEREDRAASVRQALQTLATLLGPNDRVTLIGFARTPRLLADQVPGDQAQKLVEIAARTPSEGGTNLEAALDLASELALKQRLPAAQNRIVLLTDGAANLGDADPTRLAHQIEKTRQRGISFDACGFGANGLDDEMLEALTRKGDGRYYFINEPEDADASFARKLAGAFRPAAENVKVQVVFNPSRVRQYRLIGFEKHLLKKEDFRNDKVQAAELSAEEAGVALYQVETLPEGEGELGEVFVRFRDPASGQMVERSWTMPYSAKTPSFDQASPSLQLATTAALLAEKLQRRAPVDLSPLTPFLTSLRQQYPHQAKVGDLIRMFEQVRQ